jgi:ATP-dependent Lhr-like helicase
LRALRAKRARAERERTAADAAPAVATSGARRPGARRQLALPSAEGWFAAHGWQPFEFQRAVWQHVAAGRSGLLHATTGSGKTYALWFALLNRALAGEVRGGGLRLLWLTPMRALAADTARALAEPLDDLGLDWTVAVRTGDTDASERARQAKELPEVLVTTPESLSLMLSRADSPARLSGIALVVVDEWHELIGTKRGVQLQLALSRLRALARQRAAQGAAVPLLEEGAGGGGPNWGPWPHPVARPALPVWGLSATLGNTGHAMQVLLNRDDGVLVEGRIDKKIVVDTLLPEDAGRFPWAGHLGIKMLGPVIGEIQASSTTLVFTNTRSQSELWYQSLLEARPDWAGLIALHHGSLAKEVREWVELGLKDGRLKAVVATSSLDLGVDFLPVERVLQIGSTKGVARLLQRAGRSGHAPGRPSRVTLVPTNTLELVEAKAAQRAVAERRVESRCAPERPLDVLVQHLVTIALGTGFREDELKAEVRDTWSYRELADEEWNWALDFVGRGGEALRMYPEYHRVVRDEAGVHRVPDRRIGQRHRMSIGTIVAEATMLVKMMNGRNVGTIEESFISRLRKGDAFLFGGRMLEHVRVHEMTAYVQPARRRSGAVPRWMGSKMPLSSEMADAVLRQFEDAVAGRFEGPEMQLARPLVELQAAGPSFPRATPSWWSRCGRRRAAISSSIRSPAGTCTWGWPRCSLTGSGREHPRRSRSRSTTMASNCWRPSTSTGWRRGGAAGTRSSRRSACWRTCWRA